VQFPAKADGCLYKFKTMGNVSMSNEELVVRNPFDLKVIGTVECPGWGFADKWLDRAVTLHRQRRNWLPAYQRIAILKKAATLMRDRFDQLAFGIANEGGKPLMDARIEVERAIDGVGLAVEGIGHLQGSEIPLDLTAAGAGRMAFTSREPIGPVVAVSAFNHPLNLIVHQVAPAVATGCPVIVKPADDTPLSAKAFVEILIEAGLPEEWCSFFPCDIPTAEKLVTDPRVAFFSFIGSSRVGWMLRSKLAPGTRCALEHGGVAPVIVDESADIDAMVPFLTKGGFYHAGQVCVSVQRVFAPRSMARSLAEKLAEQASRLVIGNAVEEATEVGPLIRPAEVTRVTEWVEEAAKAGGDVLCGGEAMGETAYANEH
jgi:acyl-CoA reductase-like NAD-dependent aldehyde dehydrogenase